MSDFIEPPIPQSIGRCADLYHDTRALRLAMEKEVEPVKAFESKVKQHLIDNLSKSEDTGAAGLRYRAQIVMKRIPRIADWGVVTAWIRKNDRFDMLQKRLAEKAVVDFMEQEDRLVPGTEAVNVPDVSVTKI